jgi:hypothetical protein
MKMGGFDSKVLTVSMTALECSACRDVFFDGATFGGRFFFNVTNVI